MRNCSSICTIILTSSSKLDEMADRSRTDTPPGVVRVSCNAAKITALQDQINSPVSHREASADAI